MIVTQHGCARDYSVSGAPSYYSSAHFPPVHRATVRGADRSVSMTTQDDLVREFFLGFIRVHILHHAAEEEAYGLALISDFRRHGYELSPGKMYPVLHEL